MSERIKTNADRASLRWQLLTSVSALTLLSVVYAADEAKAADGDGDHPTIWIELGAQFERADAGEEQFVPPFILATPRPGPETVSPLSVGHPPRFSMGGEGKISFEPEGSNWVFSAAVRYGRSTAAKHLRQQSYPTQPIVPPPTSSAIPAYQKAVQFVDTETHHRESHTILDFQAGRDFGVGMFGAGSSSVFNLGVRFAQFNSTSTVAFQSDPDARLLFKYIPTKFPVGAAYHFNSAKATAARSFTGIGPSLSWNASKPVVGSPADGEIAFDFGANAAVLFGRQKAKVHHQATAQYHHGKYGHASTYRTTLYRHNTDVPPRARNVIVPNVGGFAGLSYLFSDAKISFGYRADFFFGAIDGGVDAAKKENRGFYGPFATISIGIGG